MVLLLVLNLLVKGRFGVIFVHQIWMRTSILGLGVLHNEAVLVRVLISHSIRLLSWSLRSLWGRSWPLLGVQCCRCIFSHAWTKDLFISLEIIHSRWVRMKRLIRTFFLSRRILFDAHWFWLNTWGNSSLSLLTSKESLVLGVWRKICIVHL